MRLKTVNNSTERISEARTGYTKTGFSKGFGCCGHYAFCQMGKTTCIYEELDPEVANYCAAYLRNRKNEQKLESLSVLDIENEPTEMDVAIDYDEQLSLF